VISETEVMTPSECVEQLASTTCQCGKKKQRRMSHCSKCYFRLPPPMRQSLYRRVGDGYAEAYAASIEYLNDSRGTPIEGGG
jgi:hypothetical protein